MIVPVCLFIASLISGSTTNQITESTSTTQAAPTEQASEASTKIYKTKPKTLQAAFSSIVSKIDEEESQLIGELFDPNSPAQQGITPYNAMPASPHTVKQALYASKAWFASPRDTLNQHGIGFSATYTGVYLGNPVGGVHPQRSTYFDNITLTSIIDTEKLIGWRGGYFIMSAAQQDGPGGAYSIATIGNQFNVGTSAGGVTMKWVQLFYQQNFFGDRANLNIGRMCAMNEFDVSPILWNYIGSFQSFQSGAQMTNFNPNASWGARLKVNVTHDTEYRVGIFQLTQPSVNGLNWNFYSTDTYALYTQYSWNPVFHTKDLSSLLNFENIGKTKSSDTAPDPSLSDPNAPADHQIKNLPGHYFIGGFYNGAYGGPLQPPLNQQNTGGKLLPDNYAFYCHADQLVYRPNPLLDSGLTLWTESCYAPQTTYFPITFQVSGGAIYTGLIPGRRNDFTIFGINYGRWSMNAASSVASWMASYYNPNRLPYSYYPTYEANTEFAYRINLTRFCFVQPDLQWVINPGGTGHIPNALVLGVETGITF